jgi:SOS-response transcriptional repressor LexA
MVILPHMGKVAAGVPIEVNGFTGMGVPFPREKLKGNVTDYFTVEVAGSSMTAIGINDGDTVVIRKAIVPKQGKVMLVVHDGESTLKRIKIKENREAQEVYLNWEDGSGRSEMVSDPDWEIQGEFHAKLSDLGE